MNLEVLSSRVWPNKALVQTAPALCNFEITARHTGLGGSFGVVLPVKARERLHNAGVSHLL